MQADTVSYPGAVMVHANHTSFALRAMVRSRWLGRLAVVAPLPELFSDQPYLTDFKSAHLSNFNVLLTLRFREGYQAFWRRHKWRVAARFFAT